MFDSIVTLHLNWSIVSQQSLTLHFVVLSFDRYSRDDVIGEVVLPVHEALLHMKQETLLATNNTEPTDVNAVLDRDITPRSHKVTFFVCSSKPLTNLLYTILLHTTVMIFSNYKSVTHLHFS